MLPFRLVATSRHLVARCRRNASGFSTGLLGKTPAHFVSNRLGLYVARANVLNKNYSTSTTGETSAVGRVWSHKAEDVNAPQNVDLARWLMDDMGHHGDKIALVNSVTGQQVTYAQLQTNISRVGSSLVKLGIRQGDVVTLCLGNCPEYPAIYLGITAIGAAASPLNPVYTAGELHHALSFSGSKLLFTTPELLPIAEEATKNCPGFKEIVVVGSAAGYRPFSQLLEDDGTAFPDTLDVDPQRHVASLPFSSGTTGLPKGVMLSHYNLVANIQQMAHSSVMSCVGTSGSVAVVLPFFHIYGLVVILLLHLKLGAKITALQQFQPEPFLRMVQESKADFLHLAPPLIIFLAKHPLVEKYDLSSISNVLSAAAPVGPEVCEEVQAKFPNMKIRQAYGMTESSPLTHACPMEDIRLASIGTVIPETQGKVIDINSGEILPPFKEGEICSRGPQVMLGYYKNEEATAKTVDEDGWLHSGDIGYVDEDGYFYVTDRLKELIKVKGFQVAPAELEALLVTHPALADAAVIGVPDDRAGELPRAFVVRKQGVQCSEQDVMNFVEERVSPYKRLAGGVVFIDEVPKTASGKILRRQLKS